jgi:hypothetical protein
MSADEVLLDELTTLMNVVNLVGVEADSEHTNDQRVVWIPEDWDTTTKVSVQPTDGRAIGQHDRLYHVALYSNDYGGLIGLYHALRRALDAKLSLSAFLVGKCKPKGGSSGWGCLLPVTLKGPIYAEVYVPVVIETSSQEVAVDGESDTDPEEVLS